MLNEPNTSDIDHTCVQSGGQDIGVPSLTMKPLDMGRLPNRPVADWYASPRVYGKKRLPANVIERTTETIISLFLSHQLDAAIVPSTGDWLGVSASADESRPILFMDDIKAFGHVAHRSTPAACSLSAKDVPVVEWDEDTTPEWDEEKSQALRTLREFYGATDVDS